MTQTDSAPTADHIRAWLAAQPCPLCTKGQIPTCPCGDTFDEHMVGDRCIECRQPIILGSHRKCNGSGLAFEWASKICPGWFELGWPTKVGGSHEGHNRCNGSGRVPKDVGLEELAMRFEIELHPPGGLTEWIAILPTGEQGEGETPTLAALRAIAAQAGMPCAS